MGKSQGTGAGTGLAHVRKAGIVALVLACLTDPRVLAGGGVEAKGEQATGWQLVAAFAIANFLGSAVLLAFATHSGVAALAGGLVGVVSNAVGLVLLAVGFWFVAGLTRSTAPFGTLLESLALVQVLAAVVLVAFGAVAAVLALLGMTAGAAALFLTIVYVVATVVYIVILAVGVFDIGILGSLLLATVATAVASALEQTVVRGLSALIGL